MITLRSRAAHARLLQSYNGGVFRVSTPEAAHTDRSKLAVLVSPGAPAPSGFGLHLTRSGHRVSGTSCNAIELPPELDHLSTDDVLWTSPDGKNISVLWRAASHQNSVLLTEQCDNYCLMCSQPPRDIDDSWLIERAFALVRALPAGAAEILFTGGEPTVFGSRFIELLEACKTLHPEMDVHILSNGRRFAQADFAERYAEASTPKMMLGIPLYGAEPSLHDFVVQARGAFDETVRGVLNLAELGQRIEIRVVVQKQTAPELVAIAEFIARNLPFVDQVALMGLEIMGFARANLGDVWIDPFDYREALSEATLLLHRAGVRTLIFNHQLCLLEPKIWDFAVSSISDWKNEYVPACETCAVKSRCGGFFHSVKYKTSSHIRPVDLGALSG